MVDTMAMFEKYSPAGLTGLWSMLFFLACHTAFWAPFTKTMAVVIRKWVKRQPCAEQFDWLNHSTLKASYGVHMDMEAAGTFGCEIIATSNLQHFFGAALCVPALFPLVAGVLGINMDVAIFMANNGALCEAGWEIGDLLHRFNDRVLRGRVDMQPTGLIVLLCFHHFMAISMVLPMNVHYGGHLLFIETVFLLQFAAGLACSVQQYGFMLDITKPRDLVQMKVCVVSALVCMWYSRGYRYCVIYYTFMTEFSETNNTTMMVAVTVAMSMMGLINLMFLYDSWIKFTKYINMSITMSSRAAKAAKRKSL